MKCPAGTFGNVQGLGSSACSGVCRPGYYCLEGEAVSDSPYKCTAGRYGGAGQVNDRCTAECIAGYYCPAGTGSNNFVKCGESKDKPYRYYCGSGSAVPKEVDVGYFTTGSISALDPGATRSGQQICDLGSYCQDGLKYTCPAGKYGGKLGLTSAGCLVSAGYSPNCVDDPKNNCQPCEKGFYCSSGSTSPTAKDCVHAGYYCPAGSSVPLLVPVGFFSGPADSPAQNKYEIYPCPPGFFCGGFKVYNESYYSGKDVEDGMGLLPVLYFTNCSTVSIPERIQGEAVPFASIASPGPYSAFNRKVVTEIVEIKSDCGYLYQNNAYSALTLLITEIADPKDDENFRFIELYSPGGGGKKIADDLYLLRWTNGNVNPTTQYKLSLLGMELNADGFLVICRSLLAEQKYGIKCSKVIGQSGVADSDGKIVSLPDNNIVSQPYTLSTHVLCCCPPICTHT